MKIGFIGQGWVGKNYANDFEQRGYDVVRYSLEEPYIHNKDKIADCRIVFIAVPTPTTANGFDYSIVEQSLSLIGPGYTAIIKSTILPGTCEALQYKHQDIWVFHSPEFLREMTAAYDAAHPSRNIIGVPWDCYLDFRIINQAEDAAEAVMAVLPEAPYSRIMEAKAAELVKYIGNCYLYQKVVFFNQMYDLTKSLDLDYQEIREAVCKDDRIGDSHTAIAHASGHNQHVMGRGAGGHCLVKDFVAMLSIYKEKLPNDIYGIAAFEAVMKKNYSLLVQSNKDLDLLKSVISDISEFQTCSIAVNALSS
jgi:UDPglucose 6-dehydrogenase